MHDYISKIEKGIALSHDEITIVMELIMSGHAPIDEVKQFLLALNRKGPTIDEITACALIMRKFVIPVRSKHELIVDTCGTGGDHAQTFNISTVTALVVASCGVVVAKHGNRSISSRCGSADVLEALGVDVAMEEKHMPECLDKVGIAFLFAQRLHPAMKNVANARKELGVKTIFNILGPLTNPAQATHQVMGVYSRDLVEPMARVLKQLGLKRALVVHGADGLDEITITAKTFVSEYNGQDIVSYDIDPTELGFSYASSSDIQGGDISDNARMALEILSGKSGPCLDIVLMNAAYTLYTAGVVPNVQMGISMARHAIESQRALKKLNELKEFTQRVR